jgi:hypothetical protein
MTDGYMVHRMYNCGVIIKSQFTMLTPADMFDAKWAKPIDKRELRQKKLKRILKKDIYGFKIFENSNNRNN